MDEALADPHLARYLNGWGRDGDAAVIAEEGGDPIGAAWYRLFSAEEPGYGFLDASIPELSIAVRADRRGKGVGAALLDALVDRARADGHPALSLSVEAANPAASLYERCGFVKVVRDDGEWTMRLDLRRFD